MATIELPTTFRSSKDIFNDCLGAAEKYRDLKDTPENRRGDTWDADRVRASRDLLELNAQLDNAMKMEEYVREQAELEARAALAELEEKARRDGNLHGPRAAFTDLGGEYRTAGQIFTESDAYLNRRGRNSDEVEVRNLLTGSSIGTSGSNLLAPVGQPYLPPGSIQRRRFALRDLLAVQQTGLQSVPYVRELNAGALEGGASAVSEASAKPEVTMTFERDDAPMRKIAAWVQATDEALDDIPTLQGYIDTRLGYMLQIREEAEVLAGGGTSPHIKGILDFSVQTNALGSDLFKSVGESIGKIENVDGDADGIAVNPLTYWAAVVTRQSTWFDGSVNGGAGGGAPFTIPTGTIWGLPVVRTRALAAGHAIVGCWRLGATLFEREGVTIRSTDSHASLFISNTVVILAEERVGLAVHRADFFVHIS